MITPAKDAIAGLVDFARNVAADNDADCNGWATAARAARAALDAWDKREPLRDDGELVKMVADLFSHHREAGRVYAARAIIDALEPLLFGPRAGKGTTG